MSDEEYPLTPYDDFPIHQAPYPVSYIPNGEFSWDEGYMWGAVNPKLGLYFLTGFRVTPNVDTIGGHAGLNRNGLTRTLRFSREWRRLADTRVGPYSVEFTRPMQEARLALAENGSGLSFDLRWMAVAPAHLSTHHLATQRGRRTTDQSRYNQVGRVEGWIDLDGERIAVTPEDWLGIRDHSWGVYEGRPPFGGHVMAKHMPPAKIPKVKRAMRFSVFFLTDSFSGYFHLHEDEDGNQVLMNDAFGTPFEGVIDFGYDRRLELENARHKIVFAPGTRSMRSGELEIDDADGGLWKLSFEVTAPPYVIVPVGYHQGSWKDGGNLHTWHGPEDPYLEWDEFDFSNQPADHMLYGETEPRKVYGVEHLGTITITGPDGTVHHGKQHTEIFLNGKYTPYGFEAPDNSRPHGLKGRGIL